MKKFFWIFGIGLFGLLIVVVLVAGFYVGPIVKIGMEQIGPKITQVSIKVNAVDVSLLSGAAAIKDLVIGNPPGYSTPQAISVGHVAVSLDPLSVTSKKIHVRSVQVQSPEITFDGGLKGNNLSKILDNVNAFSKNLAPSSNAPTPTSSEKGSKPAPKIQVDDFLISGAKVHINLSGLSDTDIVLPDIHLTDLGKGSEGLTPAELTSTILNAINRDTLNAVTGAASKLGQNVKGLGKDAGKTAVESVNKITNSVGGLFGK